MMWYHQRGFSARRFMAFPFMLLFWIMFSSHSLVGILFSILTFLVVFSILRAVMRSATVRNRSQSYYQPPQQQQQPYYQPMQRQQPYYQPTHSSYEQGYQTIPERSYEVAEQPREAVQYEQPDQYEQPRAQYPEQMPPMQQ